MISSIMKKCKTIGTGIFLVIFLVIGFQQNAKADQEGNLIYVAYDDSGSMIKTRSQSTGEIFMTDRWCQAKYALEVFSTMLLEKDDMRIYPLNKPEANYTVSGAMDAEARKQTIANYPVEYGPYTPYATVEQAYQELAASEDSRTKWLLVVTDGAFSEVTTPQANELFRNYAQSGIHVIYLRILDLPDGYGLSDEDKMYGNPELGFYTYEADKSTDILPMLIEISNLIFKQQALSNYGLLQAENGKLQITLDMPVEQLIVFAQGREITLGNLVGNGIDLSAESVIQVSRPDIGIDDTMRYNGIDESNIKYAEGLGSVIGSYRQGILPKGTYQIEISPELQDISTVEVYCKLAVNVDAAVLKDGVKVEADKPLMEGEYQVDVTLRDPQNGEPLQSVLLDPVSYEYTITATVNGEQQQIFCNTPQTSVQLQAGSLTIDGVVHIRELTYTIPQQEYTVEKKLGSLEINCDTSVQLDATTINEKQNPLLVTVTQEGNPLSEEDWNAVELTVQGENDKIRYEVQKGSQVSTWLVYPVAVQETISDRIGEYTLNIHASLQKGSQVQAAEQTVIFNIYFQVSQVSINILQTAEYQLEELQENSADAVTGEGKNGTNVEPITAEILIDGRPITVDEWKELAVQVRVLESDGIQAAYRKEESNGTVHLLVYPYSQVDHPYLVFKNIEDQFLIQVTYTDHGISGEMVSAYTPLLVHKPGWKFMFRFWGLVAATVVGVIFVLVLLNGYSGRYKDYRKLWFDCQHVQVIRGRKEEPKEWEGVKGKKVFSSCIVPYRHTRYLFKDVSRAGITIKLLYDGEAYRISNLEDFAGNDHIKISGGKVEGNVQRRLKANSDGGLGTIQIGKMEFMNDDYEEFTLKRK